MMCDFFKKIFCKELIEENNVCKATTEVLIKETNELKAVNSFQANEIIVLNEQVVEQEAEITLLKMQLEKDTLLEKYCKSNFKQIEMPAYKQKRGIKGVFYTVALNELITPEAWAVHNLKKNIVFDGLTMKEKAVRIGNVVAGKLIWTSDFNLATSGDYYLYPNEALSLVKCDCEDHCFVVASCDLEIGTAWGYLLVNGERLGHAFNVFLHEGKLYVLETTGGVAEIYKHPSSKYEIVFIITKQYAFELKGGVQFGVLAGW
jgi:uncharacterized coiled-coil protein SlyX